MASLVDTVQFAWDRFDVYEQMATEEVQHGAYRAEQRRGRKRKRMTDEKLQTKQTSAYGKRSELRRIYSNDRQSELDKKLIKR